VGTAVTYAGVAVVIVVLMWGIYLVRGPLLRLHFGVRAPLVAASAVLFGLSLYMNVRIHVLIPRGMLLGVHEISRRSPGQLVTSGIYSKMRHPRYVAMALGITAMALFTNYLASYLVALMYIPVIYVLAVLEERELSARFGAAYRDYCARVPRFIPRIRALGSPDDGDSI
jgi:protein-S-isoprenylcysteine O-methyltransferase Ste14